MVEFATPQCITTYGILFTNIMIDPKKMYIYFIMIDPVHNMVDCIRIPEHEDWLPIFAVTTQNV